jgi:hypothetical protein
MERPNVWSILLQMVSFIANDVCLSLSVLLLVDTKIKIRVIICRQRHWPTFQTRVVCSLVKSCVTKIYHDYNYLKITAHFITKVPLNFLTGSQ